ncbi:MmyB family transcriptional regulator [Paenarthrobacter sp. NCHU4564]|uniref:MmyB family transcriptional regulator n=1 Tax=Paenarthrobacter sp. NCHU4564 TaxID=3451353 RepID=UPI003F9522A4
MTHSDDVRKFLTSRRARITPEAAGLPAYGGNRRVTGLRREEVAMLAGMSIDLKYHRTGRKRLHHPIVGDLDLSFEALELPADPGLRINVYTADPATPSEDALKVLASWVATHKEAPVHNNSVRDKPVHGKG